MKTTVNRTGILLSTFPDARVAAGLAPVAARRKIDEAKVTILRHRDRSPAFEVSIHLVTPGPDLFADGADHTLEAAFNKALTGLEHTLESRAAKRSRRGKRAPVKRDGSLDTP